MNVVVLDFHWLNITSRNISALRVSMQMEEFMCVVMSKILGFVDLLLSSDFVFYVEIHCPPASDNLLLSLVCFPPVWLSGTALIGFSCSPCICSRVPLLFPCRRNILCCVASSSEKICYFGTLASIFFLFVLFCLVVVLLVWLVVIVLVFLLSIWTLVPAGHSSAKILNKLVAFSWCFTEFKENTWSHLSWF